MSPFENEDQELMICLKFDVLTSFTNMKIYTKNIVSKPFCINIKILSLTLKMKVKDIDNLACDGTPSLCWDLKLDLRYWLYVLLTLNLLVQQIIYPSTTMTLACWNLRSMILPYQRIANGQSAI